MTDTQVIVVEYQYQGAGIGIGSQKSAIPNTKPLPILCMQSCNQKQRNNRKYVFLRTQD